MLYKSYSYKQITLSTTSTTNKKFTVTFNDTNTLKGHMFAARHIVINIIKNVTSIDDVENYMIINDRNFISNLCDFSKARNVDISCRKDNKEINSKTPIFYFMTDPSNDDIVPKNTYSFHSKHNINGVEYLGYMLNNRDIGEHHNNNYFCYKSYGCYDCINVIASQRCHNCVDCIGCILCDYCFDCNKCYDCYDCRDCKGTINSKRCDRCIKCKRCIESFDCERCSNLFGIGNETDIHDGDKDYSYMMK